VTKHAQANRVDVTLRTVNNGIRMRIKDNGSGFAVDRQRSAKGKKRLGLLGMQERLRLVNGLFVVKSSLGRGTTVDVEIPLNNASHRKPSQSFQPAGMNAPRSSTAT
jgi:signal transduction histidine kinase